MTSVREFKAEVRSAMPQGLSATETDQLRADFAKLPPMGQARVLRWLDREARSARSLEVVDLSLLRAFLASPQAATPAPAAVASSPAAPYLVAVRRSGVDTSGSIDGAEMNRLLDAAGPGKTYDFVQTMILGDSGITFHVGGEALQAIAARLSPAERELVAAQLPANARAAFQSPAPALAVDTATLTGAERLRDGGTARVHLQDADGTSMSIAASPNGTVTGAEGLDRNALRARLAVLREGQPADVARILDDILAALH